MTQEQLYPDDLAGWGAPDPSPYTSGRDIHGDLWFWNPGPNVDPRSQNPTNNCMLVPPGPSGYFGSPAMNCYMLGTPSYNDDDWHYSATFWNRDGSLYEHWDDRMAHDQVGSARPNWARFVEMPNNYLTEPDLPPSYDRIGLCRFDFKREGVGTFYLWRDGLTLPEPPDDEPTTRVRFWGR